MVHPHVDALFRPNLGNPHPFATHTPSPPDLLLSRPTTSLLCERDHAFPYSSSLYCLCDGDSDLSRLIFFAQPQARSSPSFPSPAPSLLLSATRLGMSGNALSLARAGRNPDGRTVTVDAHGILGPTWASLGYFSHGANSEVGLRAKATRHSIATTPKHPSSHALPLSPIVTYKVARRRKSFQFSLAVCLVTGSLDNSLAARRLWGKVS